MLNIPLLPSFLGMYSRSISLCRWYILLIDCHYFLDSWMHHSQLFLCPIHSSISYQTNSWQIYWCYLISSIKFWCQNRSQSLTILLLWLSHALYHQPLRFSSITTLTFKFLYRLSLLQLLLLLLLLLLLALLLLLLSLLSLLLGLKLMLRL